MILVIFLTLLCQLLNYCSAFDSVDKQFSLTNRIISRLNNSVGDQNSIQLLKILSVLRNGKLGRMQSISFAKSISSTISYSEQLLLLNTSDISLFNDIVSRCEQLETELSNLQAELNNSSWQTKYTVGMPLTHALSLYLYYNEWSLARVYAHTLNGNEETKPLYQCQQILKDCQAAIQAAKKTLEIFANNHQKHVLKLIASQFSNTANEETLAQAISSKVVAVTADPAKTTLDNYLAYLRKTFFFILNGVMIDLFCFSFRIFLCTLIFGLLVGAGIVIWIAVFVQMRASV